MTFKPKIVPVGDAAVLVQLGQEIDIAINQRVHALSARLSISPLEGVLETVPAYATLLIHYDPLILSFTQIRNYLSGKMEQVDDREFRKPKRIEVPTVYGGEHGVDLTSVAERCQLRI